MEKKKKKKKKKSFHSRKRYDEKHCIASTFVFATASTSMECPSKSFAWHMTAYAVLASSPVMVSERDPPSRKTAEGLLSLTTS